MSNLFGDMSNLFGDMSNLFGDMSNLFGDTSNLFGDTSNLFGDMSCPKTDCPKKYVFLLIVVLRYGEHKTAKKVSGLPRAIRGRRMSPKKGLRKEDSTRDAAHKYKRNEYGDGGERRTENGGDYFVRAAYTGFFEGGTLHTVLADNIGYDNGTVDHHTQGEDKSG